MPPRYRTLCLATILPSALFQPVVSMNRSDCGHQRFKMCDDVFPRILHSDQNNLVDHQSHTNHGIASFIGASRPRAVPANRRILLLQAENVTSRRCFPLLGAHRGVRIVQTPSRGFADGQGPLALGDHILGHGPWAAPGVGPADLMNATLGGELLHSADFH